MQVTQVIKINNPRLLLLTKNLYKVTNNVKIICNYQLF